VAQTQQQQGIGERQEAPPIQRPTPDYAAIAKQFSQWDEDDLQIIWQRNDELRTVEDFRFFLYYAQQHKVDPAVGEVVASYRWNSIKKRQVLTPIVTVGVLRKRRAEQCDGIDQFTFAYDGKKLESCSGTIYRKGCARPFSTTVFFDEYAATTSSGTLTSMWAGKGHMMLSKCCEAMLSRIAFYDLCGELLIDEEVQQREQPLEGAAAAGVTEEPLAVGEKPEPPETTAAPKANGAAAVPVEPPPPPPAAAAPPPPAAQPPKKEPAKKEKPAPAPPPPAAAAPAAAPAPAPAAAPAPAPKLNFDEMITVVSDKLGGGDPKANHRIIGKFFCGYLSTDTVPKDREKLTPPLEALVAVIDKKADELRRDPEALGKKMNPQAAKSKLDKEFDLLNWPAPVRDLARRVMNHAGQDEETFIGWIQLAVAGDAANGTGASIASLEPEALQILFPLYLLVKGRAFEPVDWAIAHRKGITATLLDMEQSSNKPIAKWDQIFAIRILDAIKAMTAEAESPKPPAEDSFDEWLSGGLPFEK